MQYLHKQSGFTLVETLVTISIFSVIAIIIGSTFITALNVQRRAFNVQNVEDNASFVLESMIKEIRVSTIISSDSSCSASTGLRISRPDNDTVYYFLQGTDLHREVNGVDSIINSNAVQFERLAFCVSGSDLSDKLQPRVTILARIKSSKTNQQAIINIQTSVSVRGVNS